MLLFLLLLLYEYRKRRPGSDRQNRTIATKDIFTCREEGSALFTMGYTHAYVPSMADTCIELSRGPWASGGVWRVMTLRPNGITRNKE